ncbi:MAG: hypothetical protein IT539_10590 [Bradyrhizobiaceae bacterium]|nr:hypothetical protein [Bradyrhizobiaceae bacterium]
MIRNPIAVAIALLVLGSAAADAQRLYPREWFWGRSGLFAPDYITPTLDEPGYLTGDSRSARSTRAGKLVFAAASVDDYCQQDGSPRITVLDAPRGARISTDIGSFVAVRNDGGSKRCIGRTVRGTRVYYQGRKDRIVLRVAYPTKGLTYDHVITTR